MQTFEKAYTRDTSYIMQQIWMYGCGDGAYKRFGFNNQCRPIMILRMNQGSIEIWENSKAIDWLKNAILSHNVDNRDYIDEVLATYYQKNIEIRKLWDDGELSIEKLSALIRLSKDVIADFAYFYYSALDDRTPEDIRAKAIEARNTDEFFSKNDSVIRNSLIKNYPDIRGYETAVLINELSLIPDMLELEKRFDSSFVVDQMNLFVGSVDAFVNMAKGSIVLNEDVVFPTDIKEIKGIVAQRGKITGSVRVIRRNEQLSKVTCEDIIVSPMTTPNFIHAMKLAKGYITDEGGITCHAAIVARELKKPCIIGTKVATKVLKDGDIVEVDAENGIVRIIK